MGFRISMDFYGDVQLDRTLARIGENLSDARPAWEAMADDFQRLEAAQFASQGGNSGGWPALSPKYAAWKARHYPGQPILVREGHLRDSLTRRPFGVEKIAKTDMAIGSDVDYGAFHQNGQGVPRRRPVELTGHMREQMVKRLQAHVFAAAGAGS